MSKFKNLAYDLIDLATLGKGIKRNFSGEELRFPARWSRFFTTDYEPETFDFLRQHLWDGATFLDIGAHIGLFTVVAAKYVGESGRVISFEPAPYTRKALHEIVDLNGFHNIVTIRAEAIAETSGSRLFHKTGHSLSVTNSLVENSNSKDSIEVETITLDDFVYQDDIKPDCIKVDVEGAELGLLKGAFNTLRQYQPAIRFSMHPPFIPDYRESVREIWTIISSLNYAVEMNGLPITKERFFGIKDLFDVDLFPVD